MRPDPAPGGAPRQRIHAALPKCPATAKQRREPGYTHDELESRQPQTHKRNSDQKPGTGAPLRGHKARGGGETWGVWEQGQAGMWGVLGAESASVPLPGSRCHGRILPGERH